MDSRLVTMLGRLSQAIRTLAQHTTPHPTVLAALDQVDQTLADVPADDPVPSAIPEAPPAAAVPAPEGEPEPPPTAPEGDAAA